MPTINLTAGCLHDCSYCYIRGYSSYPGEGRIVVFENTLEKLRDELSHSPSKPRAIYFSPSSDLFQPAAEVLHLAEEILQFLFGQGIGVAFLTKGHIPDDLLCLLTNHAELARAQIGLTTLDERISSTFEPSAATPQRRLEQMQALIAGGVPTEARLDPVLPGLTDAPDSTDHLFTALARVGIRRAAVGVLVLRPAIVQSLSRNVSAERMVRRLLDTYQKRQLIGLRASGSSAWTLPSEMRCEIFSLMSEAARAHGIKLSVCACKNPDLARGSCNIAGTWPRRATSAAQPPLMK